MYTRSSINTNINFIRSLKQDMANYTCVAENLAGKKYASPVVASVYGE